MVSEGLKDKEGNSIVPPIFETDRSIYYGDVSAHLASLVIKELGIKARSEKPGLAGRASIRLQSKIDREEAELVGRKAVQAVLDEKSGVMVGIFRMLGEEYEIKMELVPVEEVMLEERVLPEKYINRRGNYVTEEFVSWCKPLIGEELTEFINFR